MTVSWKPCAASGASPLVAVTVIGYVPAVPSAGTPDSTPSGPSVTPVGRAPATSAYCGAGVPAATNWKLLLRPMMKIVLVGLVNTGDAGTYSKAPMS